MLRMLATVALAIVLSSSLVCARTITVNCNGGAEFTDLRAAILTGTFDDVILVFPCTYTVGSGWPVALHSDSPMIVGMADATDITIIEGNGSRSAFIVHEGVDARMRMEHLTFRNLASVIHREYGSGGTLYFRHNVIEGCGTGLDATSVTGGSSVVDNVITGNGGIGLRTYHNSGLIRDNEICYNTAGIIGSCCETPTIRGNHVHHNSGTGVKIVFGGTVDSNTIEDNGGVGLDLWFGTVESNVIRRNHVGVALCYCGSASFYCNDILDNVLHDFEVLPDTGSCTVDATMNWWGTTDPDEIAAGIWDCNDDPSLTACVEFEPWALGPGCEPTAVDPTVSSWGTIKAMYR
jgi:hypothetical protein